MYESAGERPTKRSSRSARAASAPPSRLRPWLLLGYEKVRVYDGSFAEWETATIHRSRSS